MRFIHQNCVLWHDLVFPRLNGDLSKKCEISNKSCSELNGRGNVCMLTHFWCFGSFFGFYILGIMRLHNNRPSFLIFDCCFIDQPLSSTALSRDNLSWNIPLTVPDKYWWRETTCEVKYRLKFRRNRPF